MSKLRLNHCSLNAIPLNMVGLRDQGQSLSAFYEIVDYIRFDGQSYIDTGVIITNPIFSIDLDVKMFKPASTTSLAMVCGFKQGSSNIPRCGIGVYQGKWLLSPNNTSSIGTFDEERHQFISSTYKSGTTHYYTSVLDNNTIQDASMPSSDTFASNTTSFFIGARNNDGIAGNFIECNFYRLTLKIESKKVAEYVPAIRKADGVVGLLDIVSGAFYTNKGLGTITAGRKKVPSGYSEIVGIKMNDDTYYSIDGFRLKGSDSVKISFSATKACNVFGCYTTTTATDNYSLYLTTASGGKYLRYNGGTYLSEIVPSQRYDIEITPNGCTGFEKDSTWEEKDFEASVDMLIGSTSINATSAKFTGNIYGRIIVVDRLTLVPAIRKEDGAIGYYDLLGGAFYAPIVGNPKSLGAL